METDLAARVVAAIKGAAFEGTSRKELERETGADKATVKAGIQRLRRAGEFWAITIGPNCRIFPTKEARDSARKWVENMVAEQGGSWMRILAALERCGPDGLSPEMVAQQTKMTLAETKKVLGRMRHKERLVFIKIGRYERYFKCHEDRLNGLKAAEQAARQLRAEMRERAEKKRRDRPPRVRRAAERPLTPTFLPKKPSAQYGALNQDAEPDFSRAKKTTAATPQSLIDRFAPVEPFEHYYRDVWPQEKRA